MPAHVKSVPTGLAVTLERDGEPPEVIHARSGPEALLHTMALLSACKGLRPGDRLTVEAES